MPLMGLGLELVKVMNVGDSSSSYQVVNLSLQSGARRNLSVMSTPQAAEKLTLYQKLEPECH